jgi:hypothetical protein
MEASWGDEDLDLQRLVLIDSRVKGEALGGGLPLARRLLDEWGAPRKAASWRARSPCDQAGPAFRLCLVLLAELVGIR